MTRLEQIEKSVSDLDHEELARFSAWFEVFQAQRWDSDIAKDVASGALDDLAERALSELRADRLR